VPSEKDFPHVDKAANGLDAGGVGNLERLYLPQFLARPDVTLREYLAGLDAVLDGMPFQDYPFRSRSAAISIPTGSFW